MESKSIDIDEKKEDQTEKELVPKDGRKTRKKILEEYKKIKPEIYKKNGLRIVRPYTFIYQVYTKGRWVGKKIIDVLTSEFSSLSKEYFLDSIQKENILINRKKTYPDYILKRNDFIIHSTIRRENPILDVEPEIIYEDENYVAVDKPSSWPVHSCGNYFCNTLISILSSSLKISLYMLHRLDRQTSGVVILAKSKESAKKFAESLNSDDTEKVYFARVKGKFRQYNIRVQTYLKKDDKKKGTHIIISESSAFFFFKKNAEFSDTKNEVLKKVEIKDKKNNIYNICILQFLGDKKEEKNDICNINSINDIKNENNVENIEENNINDNNNDKDNINNINNNINDNNIETKKKDKNKYPTVNDKDVSIPKYSVTDFKFMFYDIKSNTSLVMCFPYTGRTHQIRCHLQFLGNPIANDPCYGGEIYNDLKGVDELEFSNYTYTNDDIYNHINNNNNSENNINNNNTNNTNNIANNTNTNTIKSITENNILSNANSNTTSINTNKTKTEIEPKNENNPEIHCYKIWLHAYMYKLNGKKFETKIPEWAKQEYQVGKVFI